MVSGATREYTANGQTVTIGYMVHAGMNNILANAAKLLTGFTGGSGEDVTIKGLKGTYQEIKLGDKVLAYKLTVNDGKVVVTIQSATVAKDTLMRFAELIDYEKLKTVD